MEFCKKCNSVLLPVKKGKSAFMECKGCGFKKKGSTNFKIVSSEKHEKVVVVDHDETNLPVTHKLCPKCGREKAFWWTQQTRASEESPTSFFKCIKCTYTWREN